MLITAYSVRLGQTVKLFFTDVEQKRRIALFMHAVLSTEKVIILRFTFGFCDSQTRSAIHKHTSAIHKKRKDVVIPCVPPFLRFSFDRLMPKSHHLRFIVYLDVNKTPPN